MIEVESCTQMKYSALFALLLLVSAINARSVNDTIKIPSAAPRLTVKALTDPTFYNDLGLSRADASRRFSVFYANLEVDLRFSESVGVVGMLYNSRYSMDQSIPAPLRMCVDNHSTHIAGLAIYKHLPLGSRLEFLPRIGITSTRDFLGSNSSTFNTCGPPPLSGRRAGLIAGLELRYEILHRVNLSCIVIGNTMLRRNIRHLMIAPALSISF